jgi:hypothetical protein
MRFVMALTMIGALGFGSYQYATARGFDVASIGRGPDPTPQVAIGIRCGNLAGAEARDCEFQLRARIDAGRIDPESVVRLHCTRIENVWTKHTPPEPPPVCTERFGGWLTS